MQDNQEETALHKEITAWVEATGLDVIREVVAGEFKGELEDLGFREQYYVARHGFTGAFEMDLEEIVQHIVEDIVEDKCDPGSGWKEYRESLEAELVDST